MNSDKQETYERVFAGYYEIAVRQGWSAETAETYAYQRALAAVRTESR